MGGIVQLGNSDRLNALRTWMEQGGAPNAAACQQPQQQGQGDRDQFERAMSGIQGQVMAMLLQAFLQRLMQVQATAMGQGAGQEQGQGRGNGQDQGQVQGPGQDDGQLQRQAQAQAMRAGNGQCQCGPAPDPEASAARSRRQQSFQGEGRAELARRDWRRNNPGAVPDPGNNDAPVDTGTPRGNGLESWRGAPVNQQMANRVQNPAIRAEIERQARARGIDPRVATAIVGIESGGNPRTSTGSYHGLFQLSHDEFRRYGRGGNIFDPRANIEAGLNSLQAKAATFQRQYGRPPTPTELYLAHQQGEGGLAQHLRNPNGSAVQAMLSTGEGRRRGIGWARRAIWGNVPSDMRHLFPRGVDSITSRQFAALWAYKLQGIPFQQGANQNTRYYGAFGPG